MKKLQKKKKLLIILAAKRKELYSIDLENSSEVDLPSEICFGHHGQIIPLFKLKNSIHSLDAHSLCYKLNKKSNI